MLKRTKLSVYLEIVAWALALCLLLGVILYYNVFKKTELTKVYEVGDPCPDFEITLYQSNAEPEGGTYSPQKSLGKVTILNFWYTNCGPCLKELPYFDVVQRKYSEAVKIIAVHSYSADTWVDKQAFIDEKFSDYTFSFGQDTEELKLFDHLGGVDSYPMTVIFDKVGVIRYRKQGGITQEVLQQEIEKLL